MNILYWLVAILLFCVLILIHELGHYIAARIFHVKIYEFSIGMGPKMLTYTSKKTGIKYSIGVFLFGGYVSMAGEDEESDDPDALPKKPAWQRFIITAAGATMNLLLGFLLILAIVIASANLPSNTIAQYPDDAWFEKNELTSSAEYGLQAGDTILAINGTRVHTGFDMNYEITHDGAEDCAVTVLRDGKELTLTVRFPSSVTDGVAFGITDFYTGVDEKNIGNVLRHTFYRSTTTVKMIWESVVDLFRGRYGMEAVSGPVGVAGAISQAAARDLWQTVMLMAVISINLGLFNLFPIPALDGGRLVFILFEMIFRRPVPAKYEGLVHFIGFVLLMGLMVLVLFKDIITLFS
ncbi:MAG: site-2 protease family protein [Clostridia bacterium]|nr:site-2 protease family protein [Clostridia bacterium]